MKRYVNAALFYAVMAMAGGVFYREFTKFSGFTGETVLSVVHTHYFVLGTAFFLLLLLLKKNFQFDERKTGRALTVYQAGLNLTCVMFLTRGVLQVVAFFLLLLLLKKNFQFDERKTGRALTVYQAGLNLTCVMFLTRGVLQVVGTQLSAVADASISGIAGVGHILLGIGIVLTLLQIRNAVK